MAKQKPVTPTDPPRPAPTKSVPKETYQVIRRGDTWVVEMTLYGRVFHDELSFPHQADAEKRMEELQAHK